ncbi:MAG: hypothetical protein HC780_25665 [Leptolyngbyaceae cyanobacterium CSU_1_3]|nr:hypothetical protein [Leptolyngbyaceae cyanobacterium CSU_1_3]
MFFAAAVSSRITYGPMAAIAFCLEFFYVQKDPKAKRHLILGCILFLLASGVFYLPVFFASGMSLSFLGIGPTRRVVFWALSPDLYTKISTFGVCLPSFCSSFFAIANASF